MLWVHGTRTRTRRAQRVRLIANAYLLTLAPIYLRWQCDDEGRRAPAVGTVFDVYTATAVGRLLSNGPRRGRCMVKVATLHGLLIAKRLL